MLHQGLTAHMVWYSENMVLKLEEKKRYHFILGGLNYYVLTFKLIF